MATDVILTVHLDAETGKLEIPPAKPVILRDLLSALSVKPVGTTAPTAVTAFLTQMRFVMTGMK
jgi:hypothetical protein